MDTSVNHVNIDFHLMTISILLKTNLVGKELHKPIRN